MIEFKQKAYAEFDAMRSLYVELMKDWNWKNRVSIIDSSALIPILKGNNIVIERFVINTSFFKRDNYRMYIKIGARAKLPDDVRLPGWTTEERFGKMSINFNPGFNTPKQDEFSEHLPYNGIIAQKEFGKDWNNNNKDKNKKNNDGGKFVKASYNNTIDVTHEVQRLLGEAVKYDKKERSLVLEFDDISKAVQALDILPFGINYKVYLLDV